MVALPTETGVTVPSAETVAILLSLEVQMTFLLDASDGSTVAVILLVAPPTTSVSVDGFTDTPVTLAVAGGSGMYGG